MIDRLTGTKRRNGCNRFLGLVCGCKPKKGQTLNSKRGGTGLHRSRSRTRVQS